MTYPHGHQVEAVIINWKRPQNVADIVRALKRQTVPCTVTVCDCHNSAEFRLPSESLAYIDRLYQWRHNLGSFSRYVPLGAYDHKYTFFIDDDMLPGTRCIEHFWTQAEKLRAFGALGQLGRILDAEGRYHPRDVPRGLGFTEVDLLVRAFFVPTNCLTYIPQIRAMLGESHDPEDDILLAVGLAIQAGQACYLTPADSDPETLVNKRELASPYARYARRTHLQARSRLLDRAMALGWKPILARERAGLTDGGHGTPPGDERGVLYLALGDAHRGLAAASIACLRRYGYHGAVRVVTDQPDWLPTELHCETVQVPHAGDGLASRHYKTQLLRFAFDSTLFLDADAVPIGDITDIWKFLDDCDIAMAADVHSTIGETVAMNRHRDWWRELWGDEYRLMIRLGLTSYPYFNSGVMLFRRTSGVEELFSAWHQEWQRYRTRDQMALVRAAALKATAVRTLPEIWNCQARFFASIRDAQNAGVKILHFLSANREFLTPSLASALSDQNRYPKGGDWELCHLSTEGQRFTAVNGDRGRAHRNNWGGGFLAQIVNGTKAHFELAVPSPDGGVHHYWRDLDAPIQSWNGPLTSGRSSGQVNAASLAQDRLSGQRKLEMVVRAGGKLAHYWREPSPSCRWHGPNWFADGVAGNPCLMQSNFERPGHLELVIPCATEGVAHFWRDQHHADRPWSGRAIFARELGHVDAIALIDSTLGEDRNLEVVIRVGIRLAHYWRSRKEPQRWHGPEFFFSGAAGIPSLMQSAYGQAGGFELLTPVTDGGMAHLWRDNDAPDRPWQVSTYIDRGGLRIEAVSLLPGNAGDARPADLVAVARSADETRWYWRQDRLRRKWLSVSLW